MAKCVLFSCRMIFDLLISVINRSFKQAGYVYITKAKYVLSIQKFKEGLTSCQVTAACCAFP